MTSRKQNQKAKSRANVLTVFAAASLLSSCGMIDENYQLQQWERTRISAEKELRRKHRRAALDMARESVALAEAFGDSSFRLGISLKVLGDAQFANKQNHDAELSYKRALKVLARAEKAALAEKNTGEGVSLAETRAKLLAEDQSDCLAHLGELYSQESRNADAAKCFDKAAYKYQAIIDADSSQSRPRDLNSEEELIRCLIKLAQVCSNTNDLSTAEAGYQKAVTLAARAGYDESKRREIRDAYLKLLQKSGNQSAEYQQLIADVLFNQYSSDGNLALSEGDLSSAEIAFRKAYIEAGKSVFSEQRVLYSIFNLITVFARENKSLEVMQSSQVADNFLQAHPNASLSDYDKIQEVLANYYQLSGAYQLEEQALEKALPYRARHFGKHSKELTATYAQLGFVEMKLNNRAAAERCAFKAYRLINSQKNDKSFFFAIAKTLDLMHLLGQFDEADKLGKKLIEIRKQRRDPASMEVISLQANQLVLYQRFNRHDPALTISNEMISALARGSSADRAASFSYLVVGIASAAAMGWSDIAVPLQKTARQILRNELADNFPPGLVQASWNKALELMRAHNMPVE